MNLSRSDARDLRAHWESCPLHEGRREPTVALFEFLDDAIQRGTLDDVLRQVGPSLQDGMALWHLARQAAHGVAFDDRDEKSYEACLFAVALSGTASHLDGWLKHTESRIRLEGGWSKWLETVLCLHGLPSDPPEVRVLPFAFHPVALAEATPGEIHDLKMKLIEGIPVNDHPIVAAHQRQIDLEPPARTGATPNIVRIALAVVIATERQAHPVDENEDGLFDVLVDGEPERQSHLEEIWHDAADDTGLPDEVGAHLPHMLDEALARSLTDHLVHTWILDLHDRGALDNLNAALHGPQLASLLTEASILPHPDAPNVAVVVARSTAGAMVPIYLPLAWAQAMGPDTLSDSVAQILMPEEWEDATANNELPSQPTEHFRIRPQGTQRLH